MDAPRPVVPLHHGPGWETPAGRRVAAILYAVRGEVDALCRACAHAEDGVLVVGPVADVHTLLGPAADPMAASAAASRRATAVCMFRLGALVARIELVRSRPSETVSHLRRVHAERGAGRAVVVADGDGICIAKIVPQDVELEVEVDAGAGPLAVVRGGSA